MGKTLNANESIWSQINIQTDTNTNVSLARIMANYYKQALQKN